MPEIWKFWVWNLLDLTGNTFSGEPLFSFSYVLFIYQIRKGDEIIAETPTMEYGRNLVEEFSGDLCAPCFLSDRWSVSNAFVAAPHATFIATTAAHSIQLAHGGNKLKKYSGRPLTSENTSKVCLTRKFFNIYLQICIMEFYNQIFKFFSQMRSDFFINSSFLPSCLWIILIGWIICFLREYDMEVWPDSN